MNSFKEKRSENTSSTKSITKTQSTVSLADIGKRRSSASDAKFQSLRLPALLQKNAQSKIDRRDFSWILQKKRKEIYNSVERDLSARGIAHRNDDYFRREVLKYNNMLSNIHNNLSESEIFKGHFCRAFAFDRLAMHQKAYEDYSSAIKVISTNGPAYFNRSQALTKLRRFEEALQDLTMAIKVDPENSSDYLHNRALLHRKLGNFGKAMEDYELAENCHADVQQSVKTAARQAPGTAADFSAMFVNNRGGGRLGNLIRSLQTPPGERSEKTVDEITDLISEVMAFASVPRELLKELSSLAKHVSFEEDEYVFHEGDTGSDLYVILSGFVTVRKCPVYLSSLAFDDELSEMLFGSDGVRSENIVATLYPGFSFGEIGDDEEKKPEASVEESRETPEEKNYETKQGDSNKIEAESDFQNGGAVEEKEQVPNSPSHMLRQSRRRKASIRVEEKSDFLVFETSAETNMILNKYREWQISDRISVLQKCSVFSHWPEEGLKKLAKLSMVQQFSPGSKLIEQGDVVSELFVLRTGLCNIMKSVDVSKAAGNIDTQHPLRSRDYRSIIEEAELMSDFALQKNNGVWKDFQISTITGGQIAGEFVVLESTQDIHSPISVVAATTIDALVLSKDDLLPVMQYFYGESMARIRKNLLVNSMPMDKVNSMYFSLRDWGRKKKNIISESIQINNRLRRLALEQEKAESQQFGGDSQ